MISQKMAEAINDQINAELYSAYLYFAMSAWAGGEGYGGIGAWLYAQGAEELTHAQKFFVYLQRVGSAIRLGAIEAPPAKFDSPKKVFEQVLEHEKLVTGRINDLAKLARDESDFATANEIQWFVNEQIEEEQSVNEVLDKLRLAGDSGNAIFMIDHELARRGAQG